MSNARKESEKKFNVRDLSILKKLAETDGTSGNEDQVRELMRSEFEPISSKVTVDKMGNLIAFSPPTRISSKLIMLASHMDEVGLLVKWIRPDGFISIDLSGLVDPSILPSQWVKIHTRKGIVRGIIGVRAGHFAGEERPQPDRRYLWIDVGATSKEEVYDLGIREGDFITYDRPLTFTDNGEYVFGKALDNRIGCTILIEVARELHKRRAGCNTVMVGTVMEEIGGIGAAVAARSLKPDVAIVIDGIPASDPSVKPEQSSLFVGGGPVVTKFESSIPKANVTPKWLFDLALEVAEREKIPYQIDVNSIFYDDASSISQEGVPTIPIQVARRNSHSPAEIASVRDIESTIRLIVNLVLALATKIPD